MGGCFLLSLCVMILRAGVGVGVDSTAVGLPAAAYAWCVGLPFFSFFCKSKLLTQSIKTGSSCVEHNTSFLEIRGKLGTERRCATSSGELEKKHELRTSSKKWWNMG